MQLDIWSDDWQIEDNEIWFIAGLYNAIFKIDRDTKVCTLIAEIPEINLCGFRNYSRCVKIGGYLYCLPDNSNRLWVYDILNDYFIDLKIFGRGNKDLKIFNYIKDENLLFLFSYTLQRMFVINTNQLKFIESFPVTLEENIKIINVVKIKDLIYGVSPDSGNVYEVDYITKKYKTYNIDNLDRLFTIFVVGDEFWLSGYRKEIYCWKKGESSAIIKKCFPSEFGIYDCDAKSIDCSLKEYSTPTFYRSFFCDDKIWFIPVHTNMIIKLDRKNNKIYSFSRNVDVTKPELYYSPYMNTIYVVLYFRQKKYLGLFLLKEKKIIEIDMECDTIKHLDIIFDIESLKKIKSQSILREQNDSFVRFIFTNQLYKKYLFYERQVEKWIGKQIYETLKNNSSN